MLRADTVMYADQPRLEISKDEMNDGQELVRHLGISTFGNRVVVVAAFSQTNVAAPIVGNNQSPRNDPYVMALTSRFESSCAMRPVAIDGLVLPRPRSMAYDGLERAGRSVSHDGWSRTRTARHRPIGMTVCGMGPGHCGDRPQWQSGEWSPDRPADGGDRMTG